MSGKKRDATTTTEGAAQAVLRRGASRGLATLDPQEEKVMRMRLGASVTRTSPLERVRVAGGAQSDAAIELLAYEIEAFMRLREGQHMRGSSALAVGPMRTKDKIIRALRSKSLPGKK